MSRKNKKICEEKKKKIIDKEIQIRVYNNNSPELTLTDLPGLIYNDAENDIKKLYEKYMNEKTIILTVCSANNDLDSSEAIKYAKHYYENSVIIFTKIDEVINNANSQDLYYKVMKSDIHKYKKPIIVRNTTLKEFESKVSQTEIRKKEMELIENDNYLSKLPNECKGTNSLIKLLVQYQKDILFKNRNNLLEEINNEIKKLEEEKSKLPPCAETNEEKIGIIDRCCKNFQNLIENKNLYENKSIALQLDEKFEDFKADFHKDIDIFLKESYVEKVTTAVENSSEIYLKNFKNLDCVHQFIHEQIDDYFEIKCQHFIDDIEIFMLDSLKKYIIEAFKGYDNLASYIINIYDEKITEQKNFLLDYFSKVSKIEKENIYTINPNYLKSIDKIKPNINIPNIKKKNNNNFNNNNSSNFLISNNNPFNQNNNIFNNSNNNNFNNNNFNNNNFNNNNNSTSLFSNFNNNNNNEFEVSNNDENENYDLKENVKQVLVSIFAYCSIFENRFLDSFFLCIIHVFLNYFTQEPTAIIRKNVNISLISESPEIKTKRDALNNSLKSLNDAKKKLVKLF